MRCNNFAYVLSVKTKQDVYWVSGVDETHSFFGILMFVLTFLQKINRKLYQESDSKCLFWAREPGRPVSNALITTIIQLVSKVTFNIIK